MFAYRLDELGLVQEYVVNSAVAGVNLTGLIVPRNKIWTILGAAYYPDAAETRLIEFSKLTRAGIRLPLRVPQSIALSTAIRLPLLTEGNQLILLPGEALYVTRDAATAGSIMILRAQFVESDLPTMKYFDPQKLLSQDRRRRGFARASILGRAASALGAHSGEGGEPGGEPGGGGGEGGGIPV